jgi:small conductance mechanosensitive channel
MSAPGWAGALLRQQAEEPAQRWTQAWWYEVVVGAPLRSLVIVLGAVLLTAVLRRLVRRVVRGLSKDPADLAPGAWLRLSRVAREALEESRARAERRSLRAETLGRLILSVGTALIWAIALLMVLAEFGFNLAPLIASAGIAGVAIGFGAQSVVADFLSGVFMVVEDQYGVGDTVDLGAALGVVGVIEDVGLRVTQVRDFDGTLWYVRNGTIMRVGNRSQGWGRSIVDVTVAAEADVERARAVLEQVVGDLVAEPSWEAVVLEPPEVLGVEQLSTTGILLRCAVKVRPGEQWALSRELRRRLQVALAAADIAIGTQPAAGPLRG